MSFDIKPLKILLVDDYPNMRKSIRDMLRTVDAEHISEAGDGAGALKAMGKEQFDVVLCDYSLGNGKNGQQVLEEARAGRLLPFYTTFIMISTEQTPSMVLGATEIKPDEYLAKPFNAHQLYTRIEKNHARKSYFYQVEREASRGNIAAAIHHCEQLLQNENRKMHTSTLKMRAELAMKSGDYETAEHIYQQVLEKRELNWARLSLGIIDLQQNHVQAAIDCFKGLIQSSPLFLEAYDWLSKAYLASKDTQAAEDILLQAVQLSPSSVLRQKKLARTAESNNSLQVAESAYRNAVKYGQFSMHRSSSDFVQLARIYQKTGMPEKAHSALKQLRAEFENDPVVEMHACSLENEFFQQQGEQEVADMAFKNAKNLLHSLSDPIDKYVLLDMARSCFINQDEKEANKILDSLIKNHIEDEDFMNEIRNMLTLTGKNNHCELLIQKTKQQLIDINNQGVSLFNQGKIAEALSLLQEAANAMPHNKTILFNLAKIALHDLKDNSSDKFRLSTARDLIKRATNAGITSEKQANLQYEFVRLSQQHSGK